MARIIYDNLKNVFQYGFVFGIMSLAGFIFTPIFGHYGERIGPKLLAIIGGVAQGGACILFGFLTLIEDATSFLVLSYLLRLG